jgi:hypothetical protein
VPPSSERARATKIGSPHVTSPTNYRRTKKWTIATEPWPLYLEVLVVAHHGQFMRSFVRCVKELITVTKRYRPSDVALREVEHRTERTDGATYQRGTPLTHRRIRELRRSASHIFNSPTRDLGLETTVATARAQSPTGNDVEMTNVACVARVAVKEAAINNERPSHASWYNHWQIRVARASRTKLSFGQCQSARVTINEDVVAERVAESTTQWKLSPRSNVEWRDKFSLVGHGPRAANADHYVVSVFDGVSHELYDGVEQTINIRSDVEAPTRFDWTIFIHECDINFARPDINGQTRDRLVGNPGGGHSLLRRWRDNQSRSERVRGP